MLALGGRAASRRHFPHKYLVYGPVIRAVARRRGAWAVFELLGCLPYSSRQEELHFQGTLSMRQSIEDRVRGFLPYWLYFTGFTAGHRVPATASLPLT